MFYRIVSTEFNHLGVRYENQYSLDSRTNKIYRFLIKLSKNPVKTSTKPAQGFTLKHGKLILYLSKKNQ